MADDPSVTYGFTVGRGDAAGHIPVPVDVRATFGRARPPVIVNVSGHSYRSTVAIMGGETFVPFRQSHRVAAGVSPGDTVEVTLTLDTAPRTAEAPDDLLVALDTADARADWERLSFSHQREFVGAINGAKRSLTRAKRIAAAVAKAIG